jgi:hypothetical protein
MRHVGDLSIYIIKFCKSIDPLVGPFKAGKEKGSRNVSVVVVVGAYKVKI